MLRVKKCNKEVLFDNLYELAFPEILAGCHNQINARRKAIKSRNGHFYNSYAQDWMTKMMKIEELNVGIHTFL